MGLYDYWVNTVQSGQIAKLESRIRELEEKVEILHEWVEYFRAKEQEQNDTRTRF